MSTLPVLTFGALLRRARLAAGLSQEELAERAHLSREAISALERGARRAPRQETIDLLADALNLPLEERVRLEAAARRRLAPLPKPTHDTPLHLVRAEEEQALPDQPDALPPIAPESLPTHLDEPDVPVRQPADGNLGAPRAERSNQPESVPPQALPSLPARRQSKRVLLSAVALLGASGSGLGYWLKLGPFGAGAAASATPVPGYVYAQPSHTGGTITFSTLGFPDSTNPWFLDTSNGVGLTDALWGSPYVVSPSATYLPDELAEIPSLANGEISPDGLTITMRLRPDLKWSDGQPLTADDFVYWLDVLLDSATGANTFGYDKIVSYQALDAHTLALHYKQPFAFSLVYLPYAAPRHAWGSIPHQDLSKDDADTGIYLHPEVALYPKVTSGPFMLKSYVDGQNMTLVPNPFYHSTTLHRSVLDRLIYRAYPDVDSLIAAFGAGQTAYAEGFLHDDLVKVGGVRGLHVAPNLTYTLLDFNLSQPALQDDQVRRAIEEAIDRCGIIQTVFQQPCENMRVDTILPAPSPDYDPTIKTYGYDLAQARQDMQIAGWDCPSGGICTRGDQPFPTLNLVTTIGFMVRHQATELIEQNLANLGIPVKLNYYPGEVLFNDYNSGGILATGQYDLALFTNLFGLDDDHNLSVFDSRQIPSASNPNGGNWERLNDPLIDHDLDQGRKTLDTAARTHIYKALQQVLVQKVYVVPLFLFPNLALINPAIGNYQDNPFLGGNLWNVGDWFLTG